MKVRYRILIGVVAVTLAVILLKALIGKSIVTLFSPAGVIAAAQLHLIVTEVIIMLCVAIPLLVVMFIFAWKYRARDDMDRGDNPKPERLPEKKHRTWKELLMWVVPVAVVVILAVFVWKSAHALDPYKPITSSNPPLTIEVVALEWKWLFIYPRQNIASVNFVEFPENTPIHFDLTADAPMSSFWIPQLGSQIYAMAAMQTQLNLMANSTGDFAGKDTEINGKGYAGMTFTARSATQNDFDDWVREMKSSSTYPALTSDAYAALAAPSEDNPPAYYSSVDGNLFNWIIMKFMEPTSTAQNTSGSADQPMEMMQM